MDNSSNRLFRIYKNQQYGSAVRRVKHDYYFFIMVIYFDDWFYRRSDFKQRKDYNGKRQGAKKKEK